MKRPLSPSDGFTLIEVMVAMAILVIVVLIVSTVFHQSTIAWDAGTRKAEGNMTARAVLGLMARELAEAAAEPDILTSKIGNGGNSITFVSLGGDSSRNIRVARKIKYHLDGETIVREYAESDLAQYGRWKSSREDPIAEGVDRLNFVVPFNSGEGSLPPWIRIELSMKRTDDVSGVGAESAGPNGRFEDGKNDDVRSW